ncbi:MAG: PulJ/GspJ family protein [Thermogutta sp.]
MAAAVAGPFFWQTLLNNRRGSSMRKRSGFTLVEILVATAISLIMLGAVVAVFASVMQSINQARAVLETSDRLRSAAELLRSDLRGLTVIPVPPRDPANNEGYFEYTEGLVGQNGQVRPFQAASPLAVVNLDDL